MDLTVVVSSSSSLTCHSLLGLDGLYDPPRLMTSEATLDLPSPASTSSAAPQQAATAAQNAASPTVDPSSDLSDSQVEGTSSSKGPTAAMESQAPELTTPADDPTVTEGDESSPAKSSQNSAEGVSAKTSSANTHVFPADLSNLVLSCLLVICLAWQYT